MVSFYAFEWLMYVVVFFVMLTSNLIIVVMCEFSA